MESRNFLKAIGALSLSALFVAACDRGNPMPAVTQWPDSVSGEWVVASLGDSPVVAGTRLTMVKTASDVGGYGGCNWFGIVRDSTRTLIQSTAIGCPSPISDQESRFTKQLTRAAFSIRRGDTLQLLDSARNELMTLVK